MFSCPADDCSARAERSSRCAGRIDKPQKSPRPEADAFALGRAQASTAVTFVSAAAQAADVGRRLGLARRLVAVRGCRGIGKRDMVHNSALPRIEVDPETYQVRADGAVLTCEPARVLPMAQRYFLF